MSSKDIIAHMKAFVKTYPLGTVADFALYLSTIQSINEL